MRTVSLSHRTTRIWVLWLLVGTLAAFWLQLALVEAYDGNWTSLIGVGRTSGLRVPIEKELGTLAYTIPHGYDGRYSFLIAVDPFNHRGMAALFDRPEYRYRRILYWFLAGGGGLFNGPTARGSRDPVGARHRACNRCRGGTVTSTGSRPVGGRRRTCESWCLADGAPVDTGCSGVGACFVRPAAVVGSPLHLGGGHPCSRRPDERALLDRRLFACRLGLVSP